VSSDERGIDVAPPPDPSLADILSPGALAFVADLHRRFEPRRQTLLAARGERDAALREGGSLDFLAETRDIRESDWRVPEPPEDLRDRRVEITGPTDRKLMINALNSGARTFMADFEDATTPTWRNVVEGQRNVLDAVQRTITYDSDEDGHYALNEEVATLIVRPRGWHLDEHHLRVDGAPASGGLVDFGLFMFHSARALVQRGAGPYLYLPKLEHHEEAALWNDVFVAAQDALGLERGTVRATVLVETLPAAFQMEEILHALREHSAGLNAGRWDYIFSAIKCFRDRPEFVTPDRDAVTMTVPFMRAYTELLVATCHRRGAHAMGGMSAFVPSRSDPDANEQAFAAVHEDKRREARDGFDGTWVAHPDIVQAATEEFDAVLGNRPNQIDRRRDDVEVAAGDLLDVAATPGRVTEHGVRNDVRVGFQYLSFWLGGRGAAAIDNLMEDTATAEICRSQLWQWIHHGVRLDDGRTITRDLVVGILDEEMARIRDEVGPDVWQAGRPDDTRAVFERVALGDDFPAFLTLVAYERLEEPAGD
jgi:malate synthase